MQVRIERETRKALLVSAEGRQGWIQRRWYHDGEVTAKVFERAAKECEEGQAAKAAHAAWKDGMHEIRVDRETEKAIATRVSFLSGDCEQSVDRLLWFPKSMCDGNRAPGWMIESKVSEMKASFPSNACAFLDPEDAERLFA